MDKKPTSQKIPIDPSLLLGGGPYALSVGIFVSAVNELSQIAPGAANASIVRWVCLCQMTVALVGSIVVYVIMLSRVKCQNGSNGTGQNGVTVPCVLPLLAIVLALLLVSQLRGEEPRRSPGVQRYYVNTACFRFMRAENPYYKGIFDRPVPIDPELKAQLQRIAAALEVQNMLLAVQIGQNGQREPQFYILPLPSPQGPGQPKIDLPAPGQPKIDLPAPGQPKIDLPAPGQPKIDLQAPGLPKIDLSVPGAPRIQLGPLPSTPLAPLPGPPGGPGLTPGVPGTPATPESPTARLEPPAGYQTYSRFRTTWYAIGRPVVREQHRFPNRRK